MKEGPRARNSRGSFWLSAHMQRHEGDYDAVPCARTRRRRRQQRGGGALCLQRMRRWGVGVRVPPRLITTRSRNHHVWCAAGEGPPCRNGKGDGGAKCVWWCGILPGIILKNGEGGGAVEGACRETSSERSAGRRSVTCVRHRRHVQWHTLKIEPRGNGNARTHAACPPEQVGVQQESARAPPGSATPNTQPVHAMQEGRIRPSPAEQRWQKEAGPCPGWGQWGGTWCARHESAGHRMGSGGSLKVRDAGAA